MDVFSTFEAVACGSLRVLPGGSSLEGQTPRLMNEHVATNQRCEHQNDADAVATGLAFNTHTEVYNAELPVCDTKKRTVVSNVKVRALST